MAEGWEEPEQRPKPRVVDKRVSARGEGDHDPSTGSEGAPAPQVEAPQVEPQQVEAPQVEAPRETSEATGSSHGNAQGADVWTPEQEAEAQRLLEAMAATPSLDWILNSCVTLANVAGVKLEKGDLAGSQLAIDALAALIEGLGSRLGEAETPLRRSLSQLQLGYAQVAGASAAPKTTPT